MSIDASNPKYNATVSASAGSGKTWMLITRIVRLLIEGNEPGGILAMTFTRKAAAEMQQRLAERLYQLATVDDAQLKTLLKELGMQADAKLCQRARALYEFHQYCDFPVRTQTFHSFCQEILARFPLEADVAPGFDLLEASSLLIQQARHALFNEAALDMNGQLARDLQSLSEACDGLSNMEKALNSFLQHRSDWWAFTEKAKHASGYATQILKKQLDYDPEIEPISEFFNQRMLQKLKTFASMLAKNPTKTNLKYADEIALCLTAENFDKTIFARISQCFLTQKNEPLSRKDSKALRTKLKDEADHFLELVEIIPAKILHTLEQLNKKKTYDLNRLWYLCGERFVEHYSQLKQQLRLLDFTDLEWKTYRLLQHSENALWIQYKLDQRIDHFLIDEFQDTNPTQWQLILPLLQEMADAEQQRPRSVFLVGDEKQSIYSFRRAKPELQSQAAAWLENNLNAKSFPLNKSWRSSTAIIDTVNAVFSQDKYTALLSNFTPHETHKTTLAGKIEIFPLIQSAEKDKEDVSQTVILRQPLLQAREDKSSIHIQEGQQIAQCIRHMIDQKMSVGEDDVHAVQYDDIFILVRKRSHLTDYEKALREFNIPYLSANKGTLMDCMEINDMEALLDTLITPFNNLALAQVLKSPLFDASDEDLKLIANYQSEDKNKSLWIHKIAELHLTLDKTHPIHRAHVLITRWRTLLDKIPVHDLLDRIYSEANLLKRYHSASPDSLKPRVQANLVRFLELALDLDSGRYPSLMHFLQHLRSLKALSSDAPDEAPMESDESRVRIMTIHASKGLEAPIVFLADTISRTKDRNSHATLVDWPVSKSCPSHFMLIPGSAQRDSLSKKMVDQQKQMQEKEDANLLYVAMTRAKQCLFISACLPDKKPYLDWYHDILTGIEGIAQEINENHWQYQNIELPYNADKIKKPAQVNQKSDSHLLKKLSTRVQQAQPAYQLIAPSKAVTFNDDYQGDEDGKIRGLIIHQCLDLLSRPSPITQQQVLQSVSRAFNLSQQDDLLHACLKEANACLQLASLNFIFYAEKTSQTFNELTIQYKCGNKTVLGIIDRLIVNDSEALIIDYKSHQSANNENIHSLLAQYSPQMQLYADGIKQIYPNKKIKAALLFTHIAQLHYLEF